MQMQMQGIAQVNHPNANAHANASVNARNKQIFIFSSLHLCLLPTRESAKDQSLSTILEKYFYYACVSLFPCVCVGRVNSLAFLFAFALAFAFASHVWTNFSEPSMERLFSSFQFSVPKYTLKERKNWWHKIFLAIQILAASNTSNSSILSNHLSEIFLSSKVAHLLEPVFAFASHTCESAKAQSLSAIFEKYFYCACVSLFPCITLDVWTRFHFHLHLHLHRTCEPFFRTFHGMTYL